MRQSAVDVDDVRVDGFDGVVAEAETVHSGEADIVEEDVGVFQKRREGGLSGVGPGVEDDGAFVAVQRGVDGAEVACRGGAGIAHHVARLAFLARFDLDHVGAEITEDQGGEGAKDDRTHVDNLDA